MKETQCWTWRFSPQGHLQFGQSTSTAQLREQKAAGWSQVSPATVSSRLQLLATLYQQPNLYLIYRERHPRPEHCLEPEHFQVLFKGLGDDLTYTPTVLLDIARAFVLPPSFFLLRRLTAVPRPFDGAVHRWDRMSSVRPMGNKEAVAATLSDRRTPVPGANWAALGAGDSVAAVEGAKQEGGPFLYLHRTPRMYVITYRLEKGPKEDRMLIVIETTKKRAEQAFTDIQPAGSIVSVMSALALPGLAVDARL